MSDSTAHRRTATMFCPTEPDTDVLPPCSVRQNRTQTYCHHVLSNSTGHRRTANMYCPSAPETVVVIMYCPTAPDTDALPPCTVRQHRTQTYCQNVLSVSTGHSRSHHVLPDSTGHRRTAIMYCPIAPDTVVVTMCCLHKASLRH